MLRRDVVLHGDRRVGVGLADLGVRGGVHRAQREGAIAQVAEEQAALVGVGVAQAADQPQLSVTWKVPWPNTEALVATWRKSVSSRPK